MLRLVGAAISRPRGRIEQARACRIQRAEEGRQLCREGQLVSLSCIQKTVFPTPGSLFRLQGALSEISLVEGYFGRGPEKNSHLLPTLPEELQRQELASRRMNCGSQGSCGGQKRLHRAPAM